jgi:hypothetical protein
LGVSPSGENGEIDLYHLKKGNYSAYAPSGCATRVIAWITALFPHKTAVIHRTPLAQTAFERVAE